MNHPYLRAIIIALITFLLGVGINHQTNIETALGLDTLFKIRGTRVPPDKVVIVAMDEASKKRLGLSLKDLPRWRSFHTKLIQELQRQGVALIIFDLQFIAIDPENDSTFAAAIRSAGNVLVTDCVQQLLRGVEGFYGMEQCAENNQEPFVEREGNQKVLSDQNVSLRKITATPLIAQAVLDHAPFYLTNDAEHPIIREAWTFHDTLAVAPLPVLTWLYYVQRTDAAHTAFPTTLPLSQWLTQQRQQCTRSLSQNNAEPAINTAVQQQLDELLCSEDSRYLDFYGPPHTLRMESYSDVYDGKVSNLTGKVVFVGKANRQFAEAKTDNFQTPFTNTHSGKIAGVEIMATQFANLLENRFVTSPYPPALWYILFGLWVGLLLTQFPGLVGIILSLLLGGVYAGLAAWYFNRSGAWLPVAVPVLVQLPIAWLITLVWSRRDLIKERKRILGFVSQVFPQWVSFIPAVPGQWYPEHSPKVKSKDRSVKGICLTTDIEGYTALASQHSPEEVWELLKAYYQVLGNPVTLNKGVIANIQGDAMMALWIDRSPQIQRYAACIAALEIEVAVERFNETSRTGRLPTRIGLYEGNMVLASGKVGEFRFYNPFGDTLAIASRIEGVNKLLKTKILASAKFSIDLGNIVSRPVGVFRVAGYEQEALALLEIVGIAGDVDKSQHKKFQVFAVALAAFQQGDWNNAVIGFNALLRAYGDDGPSQYYLRMAMAYQENPPSVWDGVITLIDK